MRAYNRIKTGIIICGLNGAGKSTLGKALAEELGYYFIDSEDLYFTESNDYNHALQRTENEAEEILFDKIQKHKNFIFASVKGNYGEEFYHFIRYVVLLEVPKDIRLQRIKARSFQKFENRMLPGGDLYEQEKAFFRFVESRKESTVEKWLSDLNCPVIRIDGMKPVEENVRLIIDTIK